MIFVMRPIQSQAVAAVFQSYPHAAREKLFALHTGRAPSDDPKVEFADWEKILVKNARGQKSGEPLQGKLIEFFDGGGVTRAMD